MVLSAAARRRAPIVASTAAFEVYEDRVGALQVVEPSVLGVQVAYAGYFAPLVVEPGGDRQDREDPIGRSRMPVAEKRVTEEKEKREERIQEEPVPTPTPEPSEDDKQGEQGGDQYDAPNQQAVRPDGSGPADEGDGGPQAKAKGKKSRKG